MPFPPTVHLDFQLQHRNSKADATVALAFCMSYTIIFVSYLTALMIQAGKALWLRDLVYIFNMLVFQNQKLWRDPRNMAVASKQVITETA